MEKVYKCECCVCGKKLGVGLSLAQRDGFDSVGHGSCPNCKTFLALDFKGDRVESKKWDEYLKEIKLLRESEIELVDEKLIDEVIEKREPLGKFICEDNKTGWCVAVDNTIGEAFAEDCKTKEIAIKWLNYEIDLGKLYELNGR